MALSSAELWHDVLVRLSEVQEGQVVIAHAIADLGSVVADLSTQVGLPVGTGGQAALGAAGPQQPALEAGPKTGVDAEEDAGLGMYVAGITPEHEAEAAMSILVDAGDAEDVGTPDVADAESAADLESEVISEDAVDDGNDDLTEEDGDDERTSTRRRFRLFRRRGETTVDDDVVADAVDDAVADAVEAPEDAELADEVQATAEDDPAAEVGEMAEDDPAAEVVEMAEDDPEAEVVEVADVVDIEPPAPVAPEPFVYTPAATVKAAEPAPQPLVYTPAAVAPATTEPTPQPLVYMPATAAAPVAMEPAPQPHGYTPATAEMAFSDPIEDVSLEIHDGVDGESGTGLGHEPEPVLAGIGAAVQSSASMATEILATASSAGDAAAAASEPGPFIISEDVTLISRNRKRRLPLRGR